MFVGTGVGVVVEGLGVLVGLGVSVGFGVGVLVSGRGVSVGDRSVGVGGTGVSVGTMATEVSMGVDVSAGATVGGGGKDGKISRIMASPINNTPIPDAKKRGYFPIEGIFIADISNPPPKRPIKKKTAPIKSKTPSFVCGTLPSDV